MAPLNPSQPPAGGGTDDLTAKRRLHARAKDIVGDALAAAPPARAAFLAEACQGDDQLRREVESLLAFAEASFTSVAMPLVAAAVELEPLPSGHLVAGRYRVACLLGEGGMGQVYRVRDTLLDVDLALKRLRVSGPVQRWRLLEEARLARQVTHPAVCRIHDAAEHDGETYLTMELLEGVTLARRLALDGPLGSPRVAELGLELCDALAAAHAAGVIHGDLKPANVMVGEDLRIRIVDFGLARALHRATDEGLSGGSLAYLAPEQLVPGAQLDERTDLHALGLVLHEMLTARPVFDAEDPQALLERVRTWTPSPPSALVAGVDPRLDVVVMRLLQKDPRHRPRSAREVARALVGAPRQDASPSPARRQGRLPRALTALIGRRDLLDGLGRLVEEHPLVTLAGPGGSGKTRLAVEHARRSRETFAGGTWFADFSGQRGGEGVVHEVARVLGVSDSAGVAPLEAITAMVRGARTLLVLDNCEHVREAAASLAVSLLADAPGLHVLSTSREPLGVRGEQVLHVPPLDVPAGTMDADPVSARGVDAVALFEERARAYQPGFELDAASTPLVARICRALDGLPLAIELAASCLRSSSLADVAARLDETFPELVNPDPLAPAHHASVRALVDWSTSRLSPEEAALFRRVSVFAGGFAVEDCERACARGPVQRSRLRALLASLVDRSLLRVERAGPDRVRYRMLETLRAHGAELLESAGETRVLRDAHLAVFLRLAMDAQEPLLGRGAAAWIARLEPELDNIRAALTHGRTTARRATRALRMASALWPLFEARGHVTEMRERMLTLIATAGGATDPAAIGWAHYRVGNAWTLVGRHADAARHYQTARELGEQAGDLELFGHARFGLGMTAADSGDMEGGRRHFEDGFARASEGGALQAAARCLNGLANMESRAGRPDDGRELRLRALELGRRAGLASYEVVLLSNLASMSESMGRLDEARQFLDRALALSQEIDPARWWFPTLVGAAVLRGTMGDQAGVVTMLEPAFARALAERNVAYAEGLARYLAMGQAHVGDHDGADRTIRDVLELTLGSGTPRSRFEIAEVLAGCWLLARRHAAAVRLGAAAREERRRLRQPRATGKASWLDEHEPELVAALDEEEYGSQVDQGSSVPLLDQLRGFRERA